MTKELPDYRPLWPETVVFWGAGATRALYMRTTVELGQAVYCLAAGEGSLLERVSLLFPLPGAAQPVADLLTVLGEEQAEKALQRLFPALSEAKRRERQRELRQSYDWLTLCQLVRVCPGHSATAFRLQDLFTLLDMHMESRHGFYVDTREGEGRRFVPPESLLPARNALVMLIGLIHFHDVQRSLQENPDVFQQYITFAEVLASRMVSEGLELAQSQRYADRAYYLFSYAVISMNWDPLLLWFLFNAYNRKNDRCETDSPGLRLFHDFGHFILFRS